MQIPRTLTRFVFLVSVFLSSATFTAGATLYGKVEKIDEGDVLTMNNLNRSIKIRLLGIDAPEKGQAFAEVSRQHLSDLVLNKFVVVHYSGLGEMNQIVGRVIVGEMDVSAQMIRDGAAWYAGRDGNLLSPAEREMYGESEKLAREERRGLWEDASPVAPWNFKQTLALVPSQQVPQSTTSKKLPGGFSNEDLMTAVSGATTKSSNWSALNGESYSGWHTISPEGFNFTVSVPANTREGGALIPTMNGGTADVNAAIGTDGQTVYVVFWGKGPLYGDSDSVADDAVRGLLQGINRNLRGRELFSKAERRLRVGSLTGWQYRLSGTDVVGIVRALSKRSRSELQIFALVVLNGNEQDKSVTDFLNSLKLNK